MISTALSKPVNSGNDMTSSKLKVGNVKVKSLNDSKLSHEEPYPVYSQNPFRLFMSYCYYPLVLVASMILTQYLLNNTNLDGLGIAVSLVMCVYPLVIFAELVQPHCLAWRPKLKEDLSVDFLNITLIGPANEIINQILRAAFVLLGTYAIGMLFEERSVLWPNEWHWAAQLGLAMVISEFGSYLYHRFAHETFIGWRLHAIHHAPKILYIFNAGRFQLFDLIFINFFSSFLLVLLLGAPEEVIIMQLAFSIAHGNFQHSNFRFHLGFLNYILAGAELHRWHHSKNEKYCNKNYGNNLIIWDLVFGSFCWPKDKVQAADDIGIQFPNFPEGFIATQLATFNWRKIQAEAKKDEPEASSRKKTARTRARPNDAVLLDLSKYQVSESEIRNTSISFKSSSVVLQGESRTILTLAESKGLTLKYGCRTGICGRCECTKIKGKVINISNGELVGEDVSRVRPCVSLAVGEVELDL